MAGLSIYKYRVSHDSQTLQIGKRHLVPLLRALKNMEEELSSEDNDQSKDDRLPYMQRISFLMCMKALMADCFSCLHQRDLALESSMDFLRIARRNAHLMQYFYCGMLPMVTITVGMY